MSFVSIFDVTVLWFVTALLLLSVFSLCFIFQLCFKSRTSHHLQRFNTPWTVRSLFVLFVILWTLTELLRLPVLRHRRAGLRLSQPQEANLCKVHVALSLGLFEPAFLVTLLFLVDVSVKKEIPHGRWAVASVLAMCFPIFCLQLLILFNPKLESLGLPEYFLRSSVVFGAEQGQKTVFCAYPLLCTTVFGAFGLAYSFMFLLSAWRVVSLVINKALRVRIYGLATAVLVSLPVQVVLLGLSVVWTPDDAAFAAVSLAVFLSAFACAVVGEGILVIKPIADSLAVWGHCCPWDPWRRPVAEGGA